MAASGGRELHPFRIERAKALCAALQVTETPGGLSCFGAPGLTPWLESWSGE